MVARRRQLERQSPLGGRLPRMVGGVQQPCHLAVRRCGPGAFSAPPRRSPDRRCTPRSRGALPRSTSGPCGSGPGRGRTCSTAWCAWRSRPRTERRRRPTRSLGASSPSARRSARPIRRWDRLLYGIHSVESYLRVGCPPSRLKTVGHPY